MGCRVACDEGPAVEAQAEGEEGEAALLDQVCERLLECEPGLYLIWVSKFRVYGLGFRVQSLGFSVQGIGFRVKGLGLRV